MHPQDIMAAAAAAGGAGILVFMVIRAKNRLLLWAAPGSWAEKAR